MTGNISYNARVTPEQQNCANQGCAPLYPSPAINGLGRKLGMGMANIPTETSSIFGDGDV